MLDYNTQEQLTIFIDNLVFKFVRKKCGKIDDMIT